jgi:hypothetical protein
VTAAVFRIDSYRTNPVLMGNQEVDSLEADDVGSQYEETALRHCALRHASS